MRRWSRVALSGAAVVALAGTLLAVGAAAGSSPAPETQARGTSVSSASPLDASISKLQTDLRRIPGNYRGWAELGLAYVQKARLTADPTLYIKADGALATSLKVMPKDNDLALTGQATLASARHDFAGALALTDRSLKINPYSATTYAVRSDALTELARYDDARTSIQQLLDLRPGSDGLTRASYAFELRGDVTRARSLLEQAAKEAFAPSDQAFAQYYLGELAFNNSDLAGARAAYDEALRLDPTYLAALGGRAKVAAAEGDPQAALADYREVVQRLPLPLYLVEIGELLEATGQTEAARQQYDVVRAAQQLYAAAGQDVDTELAVFEADHGTPQAALASAKKAFGKRPQAIFTQDAYAWALHTNGDTAQALPLARQAVRLGFNYPIFYYHLGVIEAAAGNKARAVAALDKALALNPEWNPLQAPKARALLATLR